MESPIGTLLLVSDGASLCALGYADGEDRPSHPGGGDGAGRARRPGYADGEDRLARLLRARYGEARLREAADPQGFGSRLRAYLAGDLGALAAIPVETGGTPFQRRVWEALRTIPAGTTVTYGALAAQLGRPEASRAVGQANGRNPVPIVVPCHRVVGARAGAGLALTGYGGGLARKRWLLEHEGALATLEGEGG